jgi:cysteine desulfurase
VDYVYLDHHATTRVDPRVVAAMLPFLEGDFGNSGSPHALGKRAEAAVEHARAQVARLIGAHPAEIVFTSGATESDNLALCGVREWCGQLGDGLITTPIEHKAILECAERLVGSGCRATHLPVSPEGLVSARDVAQAIDPGTLLVSVMLGNK